MQEEGEESVDCDVGGRGDTRSIMSKLAAIDMSRSSSERGGSPALSRFWMTSRGSICCCCEAGCSLLVLTQVVQ